MFTQISEEIKNKFSFIFIILIIEIQFVFFSTNLVLVVLSLGEICHLKSPRLKEALKIRKWVQIFCPFFLDLNESTYLIFLNWSFLFPPRAVLRLQPEMVWQVAPRIDAQVATGNSMPSGAELSCVRYQNEMRSRLLSDPSRRGVYTQQGIDLARVSRFSYLKLHSFI